MKQSEILEEIVIDLEGMRSAPLNEGFGILFKFWTKKILSFLLGDSPGQPVKIKGRPRDVRRFVDVIGNEKKYVEAYRDYGLDDPHTYRNRARLKTAVSSFERTTGLSWPVKY